MSGHRIFRNGVMYGGNVDSVNGETGDVVLASGGIPYADDPAYTVYDELARKLNVADIATSTGDSNYIPMGQKAVTDLFESVVGAGFKVVVSTGLPEEGEGNKLYLIGPKDDGAYDEYVWVENESKYEQIGHTGFSIDDSLYVKTLYQNDEGVDVVTIDVAPDSPIDSPRLSIRSAGQNSTSPTILMKETSVSIGVEHCKIDVSNSRVRLSTGNTSYLEVTETSWPRVGGMFGGGGSRVATIPFAVNGKSADPTTADINLAKSDIPGLSMVDNTSDMDKPVSTATQSALDGKINNGGGVTEVRADFSSIEEAVSYSTSNPTALVFF